MPDHNQKTIREIINEISFEFGKANLFYGHGTDNAFDEAVYLVFTLLNLPFDIEDQKLNDIVSADNYHDIYHLARRRITERIPVAYLMNKAWFCGHSFYVDERVLVPRSPIAELIEEEFAPWLSLSDRTPEILDIGTGSGCIAISAAFAFPDATIDAVDISQDALDVASINVEEYGLTSRVNLVNSDLFKNLKGNKYDLIIANPPYVDRVDMEQLPDEYRHEPISGLAAGVDGLDIVRTILNESNIYLNDKGILIVEVGNSRPALEMAFPHLPFTWLDFDRGGEGVFLLYKEDL